MNPEPEINSFDLARIVIGDSIRSVYTDPNLLKGTTLEDILDRLNDKEGDLMVQSVLAGYAASEHAMVASGEPINLDKRLLGKKLNISAVKLKVELKKQLSEFLSLEEEPRRIFLQGLLSK
ncbi:hypothetical protein HZB78_05995 [Candidatus Collierbacteria bacterium]|nr:hypothetical protein [Candidatus Collierbacteria bacterium]